MYCIQGKQQFGVNSVCGPPVKIFTTVSTTKFENFINVLLTELACTERTEHEQLQPGFLTLLSLLPLKMDF